MEFCQPSQATGKLFRFPTEAAALAWLRAGNTRPLQNAETVVVSPESPLPGAPNATDLILHAPTGRPVGPLHDPTQVLYFIKESTENRPLPYSTAAEAIHTLLARSKLDVLELQLARVWAPRFSIEDRLRPDEFGVAGTIEKPWRAQNAKSYSPLPSPSITKVIEQTK